MMTFNGAESQGDMALSILYVSYLFKRIGEGMGATQGCYFLLKQGQGYKLQLLVRVVTNFFPSSKHLACDTP